MTMSTSPTRIDVTIAGCPNGIPTSSKGKGHFGVPAGSEFARLDLEVATYLEPLGWDLALALPGLLEPLLFVLSRLPVGLSKEATAAWHDEHAVGPVCALTECRLAEGVEGVVASSEAVHAITVREGAVSVRTELRRAESGFEAQERVACMETTRAAQPLPLGLAGAALLATSEAETSFDRRCTLVTTTRLSWPHDLPLFRVVPPATAIVLGRAPWGDSGRLIRATIEDARQI